MIIHHFHLQPQFINESFHILHIKKKIIENPIVDNILDMIAKANIDRLDFGLKKITNNYSHVAFTSEDKYQNYKPDPDSKTKIIYSRKLFQYGDMVGLRYH